MILADPNIFINFWNNPNEYLKNVFIIFVFPFHETENFAIDIKNGVSYNNSNRKACFSSGLTLKSDVLVNFMIDRWRATLKSEILTSVYWSLADNSKISHKERVCSTVVLLLSL